MAYDYMRRNYNTRGGRRGNYQVSNQPVKRIEIPRRRLVLCCTKQTRTQYLVGFYNEAKKQCWDIRQGNLEELTLKLVDEILDNIETNDVESDVFTELYLPDASKNLINGRAIDFIRNKCRINGGEIIDEKILDLYNKVLDKYHSSWKNVALLSYSDQDRDLSESSREWSEDLFDDIVSGRCSYESEEIDDTFKKNEPLSKLDELKARWAADVADGFMTQEEFDARVAKASTQA